MHSLLWQKSCWVHIDSKKITALRMSQGLSKCNVSNRGMAPKTNTRYFILASYRAECYRHSFPTLKTNTQHLFLASYGAECYRHSFPTLKTNSPTFIFSVIWSRMLPTFISDAKDKHPRHKDTLYKHVIFLWRSCK